MMSLRSRACFWICFLLVLFSTAAIAQTTINVPADQPTIQSAISAATAGDTVLVAPGTYIENINFGGKAITVTSSAGAASTIIDGGAAGSVVTFNHGETTSSVLSGFTIIHGKTSFEGGGVEISSASPTIENNVITQNQACGYGNGVEASSSSAIIRKNTISNNTPGPCSGGMGGGVAILGAGSVQLLNNVITGNTAPSGADGGGVGLNSAGTPTISGNVIQGNTASGDGGGLAFVNSSNALVIQNLITGNSGGQGGGIYLIVPSGEPGPKFVNNTIANNAASQGSAAYLGYFYQQTQFSNNLLIGASGAQAIYCDTQGGAITPIFQNNDAFSLSGVGFAGSCSSALNTNRNISSDPLFVSTAQNDFHLQPGSPAIDAGDITNPNLPAQDISGAARLGDDSGQCNFVIDLGVYESHPAAPGSASLSSTALAFPDTAVGNSSAPLPLLLTGTGQGCFRITGFNLSGDFTQTNSCGAGVPAGQSCTVQMSFIPTLAGLRTGTLTVPMSTNMGTAPGPVTLTGTGLIAHGTPSPSSLSFPGQNVNTSSAPQTITLTNDGAATLAVSSVSVTSDFTQTNNCGSPIAPGASCSIQVTFTPTANGQRNGSLSIAGNSSPAVAAVSLAGSGIGPQGSFSPTALSFSTQLVNTTSAAENVTLTNVGGFPLILSGFSTSGDFAETNNCPATLALNASCSLQVTFTPTAFGQRNGALFVASNSNPTVPNLSLVGFGSASQASLSPTALSFTTPQVVNTTSVAQRIVLRNVGNLPLNISGFSISGDYAQTNSCPGVLASGAACSIEVTFTPTAAGARPGTLSISSDSATPIAPVQVAGTGSSQATVNVPADQPTIQAAINAAALGATVVVAPGIYVENINFGGKSITVTSSGSASSTVIDGNGAGTVVTFNQGETSSAVLNGFTIRNGRSQYDAGGVEIWNASPKITNNIISGNGGISGIAIHVDGGSPLIQGNTITNNLQNMGSGGGGAIYISGPSGAASNVSVIGNTITDNHLDAGASGGGISLNYYGSALIENNYIARNSAYNGGGGIDVLSYVPVTIVGNVIANNSSGSGGDGGGIYLQGGGQVLVLNNTLYGNLSTYYGTSEIATSVYPAYAIFENNIAYATSGTAINCSSSSSLTATNNIVYSLSPATIGNCAPFGTGNGNLFADPSLVNPAGGDFHLRVGSPGIDAGVSDPNLPATDIGGTTRVLDGNNDGVAAVDIGAYEFLPTPAVALSTTSIAFGNQSVGSTSAPQIVVLTNSGTGPLSIVSLSATSPFAQTNNCGTSLAAGASCTISITFAPTSRGVASGNLAVNVAAPATSQTVALSGTGIVPTASLSPASLSFPMQRDGSASSPQVVMLSNTGNSTLTISSIGISGTTVFSQGNNCPATLAAGASCSINVSFLPSQTGNYSGSVVVTDDSGAVSGSQQTISLTGSSGASIANVSPVSLTFGATTVGTSSSPAAVTITNSGTMPLNISSISASGDFSQSNNCASSVAPGGNCVVNVVFAPTTGGSRTGALTLTSDAQNGTVQAVSLSGTGFVPAPAPTVDVIKSADHNGPSSSITVSGLTTHVAREYLVAFVSTDGPNPGSMTVSSIVTNGLTWNLIARANQQAGTAEIWGAWTTTLLTNASVQARLSRSESSSMTVVALAGVSSAAPVGATAIASAASGAPTISLNTVGWNSLVFAVGNDWDNAIGRTVGPNQILVHQYLPSVGDTYWVQEINGALPSPGVVIINDIAPTSDRYNFAAVEILAGT